MKGRPKKESAESENSETEGSSPVKAQVDNPY